MQTSDALDFEELFSSYSETLLHYLKTRTSTPEDAEDLKQEIFAKCWRYQERFDPQKAPPQAWLFMVARSCLKNYYRDRRPMESLDQMAAGLLPEGEDPADQAVRLAEYRELLARALARLPRRSQEIVILRYFGERSSGEIAETLGLTAGNVRVILTRALNQMETYLRTCL